MHGWHGWREQKAQGKKSACCYSMGMHTRSSPMQGHPQIEMGTCKGRGWGGRKKGKLKISRKTIGSQWEFHLNDSGRRKEKRRKRPQSLNTQAQSLALLLPSSTALPAAKGLAQFITVPKPSATITSSPCHNLFTCTWFMNYKEFETTGNFSCIDTPLLVSCPDE